MNTLELQGVAKKINGERVLENIDLTIPRGVIVVVRGRSGVGKSTLAKIAALIIDPDSGRVVFNGRDVSGLSEHEKSALRLRYIGYVDQDCTLINELTVWENIELPLKLLGVEKNRRIEIVNSVVEALGLKGLEYRRPRELSGGQRQRVAIARALAKKPLLLVADEPLAHLDDETARIVLDYIREVAGETGMSVLMTTTDLYTRLEVDRDYLLVNGVLRENL